MASRNMAVTGAERSDAQINPRDVATLNARLAALQTGIPFFPDIDKDFAATPQQAGQYAAYLRLSTRQPGKVILSVQKPDRSLVKWTFDSPAEVVGFIANCRSDGIALVPYVRAEENASGMVDHGHSVYVSPEVARAAAGPVAHADALLRPVDPSARPMLAPPRDTASASSSRSGSPSARYMSAHAFQSGAAAADPVPPLGVYGAGLRGDTALCHLPLHENVGEMSREMTEPCLLQPGHFLVRHSKRTQSDVVSFRPEPSARFVHMKVDEFEGLWRETPAADPEEIRQKLENDTTTGMFIFVATAGAHRNTLCVATPTGGIVPFVTAPAGEPVFGPLPVVPAPARAAAVPAASVAGGPAAEQPRGEVPTFDGLRGATTLPDGTRDAAFSTALVPANKPKNRYDDILALECSRVRLAGKEPAGSEDYINANYLDVSGPDGRHVFSKCIATQGPLPQTQNDFWHMVWQEGTEVIVMLTGLSENGRVKCHQYWPSPDAPLVIANCPVAGQTLTVTQGANEHVDSRVVTQFRLTVTQSDGTVVGARSVTHDWNPEFKDHSSAILMDDLAGSMARAVGRNVVVHCSAGIGRTGMFVGASYVAWRKDQDPTWGGVRAQCETHDMLIRLRRTGRAGLVQTKTQYDFVMQYAGNDSPA